VTIFNGTLLLKQGTSADWTAANSILKLGEPGFEVDTGKLKIGDGTSVWSALAYIGGGSTATTDAGALTTGILADARLSTATTAALSKAGTAVQPAGLTKAAVGLGNVDNTADTAKPVSTAQATALGAKADLVSGLVPTSQIPALALTTAVPVDSQAAMLALTAAQVQPGDLAVRSDGAGTFILTTADPSVLASWTRLNAPTDAVTSVNGQLGTVSLAAADVGAPPTTRAITAGTGLTGGGTLAADRALAVAYGTAAGTAAQGNDGRLADPRAPSGAAGGDLAGTYPNPSVAKVAGVAITGTPTAGQVPTASSGTAAAWATPAAGGGGVGRWGSKPLSGLWTGSTLMSVNRSVTPALNSAYYSPIIFDDACNFTAIGLYTATGVTGSLLRLALYTSGSTGYPATLVGDYGTVDTSTGGSKSITATINLAAGVYWFAVALQGTAGANVTSGGGNSGEVFGLANPSVGNNPGDVWSNQGLSSIKSTVSIGGAFPTTATVTIEQGTFVKPIVALLAA
jgi:hypothetical protein